MLIIIPKWARRAAGLCAALLAACLFVLFLLHGYLNDTSVPRNEDLIPAGTSPTAMALFPHPDDEVTCAGTLLKLHELGAKTVLIYLTRGEAGLTGGLVGQAALARARTEESHEAAAVLKVDSVEMFDFPDNGLEHVAPEKIKAAIRTVIERYRPSVLITYDDKIGLYGHPDHRLSARYAHEIFNDGLRNPHFPVKRLYQVTLPAGMIKAGLKVSEMFRKNYPRDPSQGLPKPDLAVNISAYGSLKKKALLAHRTQWQVLGDMQPLINVIPGWIYYRVFDTEYYSTFPSHRNLP